MNPLTPFYGDHPRLRAVIDAVLEGRQGSIFTLDDPPTAARLDLGCYHVPGGDSSSPVARELVAGLKGPLEFIVTGDDPWHELLVEIYGERVVDRPMQAFGPEELDRGHLTELAGGLPTAYQLDSVGLAEAAALDSRMTPHGIEVFGGAEGFVADGFGVCAVFAGEPVCAATTYSISSDKAEVAISTREDHRGRGLATAVSAAMLNECLERNLQPHWNAHNPVSQRLALRLGLTPAGRCEILVLDG